MGRRAHTLRAVGGATLALLVGGAGPAAAAGELDLWVSGAAGCRDDRPRSEVTVPERAWCTIGRAAALVQPGDTVRVRPGRYPEALRPSVSGTSDRPIRFVAEPGVTVDATGRTAALTLIGSSNLTFSGFTFTGGGVRGVWVEGSASIVLDGGEIAGNGGPGVQVKTTRDLTLRDTVLTGNTGAGLQELAGTVGTRLLDSQVTENGKDGRPYNGDGVQLAGTGALVFGNLIARNGDAGPYEHGVYAATAAVGWTIEQNVIEDNAGANVKASGAGAVRRNQIGGARFGLVLSDNPAAVEVTCNVILGRFQHAVLVTAGAMPARARLWANTIVQTGRSTTSGDASAVFVVAAASLELRDNLIAYTASDNLGLAFWVNDPTRLASLSANANWYAGTDPAGRVLAWRGSRTTVAAWRTSSGQDLDSIVSGAPVVGPGGHVLSTDLGAGLGEPLGLVEDVDGLPFTTPPTIGAHG